MHSLCVFFSKNGVFDHTKRFQQRRISKLRASILILLRDFFRIREYERFFLELANMREIERDERIFVISEMGIICRHGGNVIFFLFAEHPLKALLSVWGCFTKTNLQKLFPTVNLAIGEGSARKLLKPPNNGYNSHWTFSQAVFVQAMCLTMSCRHVPTVRKGLLRHVLGWWRTLASLGLP